MSAEEDQASLLDLSVVIPVYGAERVLRRLVERLCAVLDDMRLHYEIIFVNDDSPDGSWNVLRELQSEHPDRITVIRLTRNFGQHNATMCGFSEVRGRYVLTLDDDLQHPPEEIPKLWNALHESGLDVMYGRYREKRHHAFRNIGSWSLNLVYRKIFGLAARFSSFRLVRRELIDAAVSYQLNFTFIDGLLAWNTTRIGSVEVRHDARDEGRSGYSVGKLLLLALNLLTNFSLVPLQAATLLGFVAAGSGLAVGLMYLARAVFGQIAVPGYASIITAVLFLGGAQLLALGVIGEYVGRLHLNVNRKPQFLEREIIRHSDGFPGSLRD
jgi:undecaprenyl-phosphate 4-deoxy-4-formamido-L-arabinose transferase